jgi:hypothetical protein
MSNQNLNTICDRCGATLSVTFIYPPIPIRTSDYSCVCPDCYDGAPDSGEVSRIQGHGATAAEAVADWKEQIEEHVPPIPYELSDLFGDLERQLKHEKHSCSRVLYWVKMNAGAGRLREAAFSASEAIERAGWNKRTREVAA